MLKPLCSSILLIMPLTLSARVFAFIAKPQILRQVRKEHFSTLNASSTPSYWERLNQPKSVMAPMVAQSDLPFRKLCRKYDTDLCFTQMIHATNFVASEAFQDSHLDVYKFNEEILMSPSGLNALNYLNWDDFLQRNSEKEHLKDLIEGGQVQTWSAYEEGAGINNPLVVQIAGHDPQTMSETAQIILARTNESTSPGEYIGPVSGIDINCGCPQGIARKGRYGAFLMEESVDIVCSIVAAIRRDIPENVGISCKIRIPENVGQPAGDAVLKERICKLIDAGVELITVHGRTVKENKTKVRECNWDAIAKVVKIAREYSGDEHFPIISNGGIEFSTDVKQCLEETGASAVMSSEALLENPALFSLGASSDTEMLPKDVFERQLRICHEYLDLCVLYPPIPGSLGKVGGSFNCIRAHIFKFLYRYLEEQPDLREVLGHPTKVSSIQQTRDLLNEVGRRYESDDIIWKDLKSFNVKESSWYRRHRSAITNSKSRIRGQKVVSELDGLSIEEKKALMKKRLKKMKERRNRSKVQV